MTRALFWLVCHGLDNSGSKKVRIDREFNIVYGPNLLSSVNTYCLSYQTQPTCPVGRFSVSFNMLSKSKISQKWSRFYDLIQSFAFKIKLYLKIQGMQILYQISLETHGLTSTIFFFWKHEAHITLYRLFSGLYLRALTLLILAARRRRVTWNLNLANDLTRQTLLDLGRASWLILRRNVLPKRK